jgi:hypothetical protein
MTATSRLRVLATGPIAIARPGSPLVWERWYRPLALGLALLGLVFAGWNFYQLTQPMWGQLWGMDRAIYHDAAVRWLRGDVFYYPQQLTGPYEIRQGHVLYPPTALIWLLPGALLPDFVWFGLPPLVVAAVVVWHRPKPWAWPVLAALLASNDTAQMLVSGTPTTWIALFVAIGTVWRPAFALVFLKPTLAPFALLGIRHRGWWVGTLFLGAVSLLMLPMWLDYLRVVLNATGPLATPLYSVKDAPLVALPVVAWISGRRPPRGQGWRAELTFRRPLRPQAFHAPGAILRR